MKATGEVSPRCLWPPVVVAGSWTWVHLPPSSPGKSDPSQLPHPARDAFTYVAFCALSIQNPHLSYPSIDMSMYVNGEAFINERRSEYVYK